MASIVDITKGFDLQTLREGAGGGDSGPCPFDIYLSSEGSNYKVIIHPGTVNGLLVSNYLTGVLVPKESTRYLYIRCEAGTNGAIISALLMVSDSPPSAFSVNESAPPLSFEILIGIINNGTSYKVWGCKNMTASTEERFRTSKINPVPGEMPYIIWYTWTVT